MMAIKSHPQFAAQGGHGLNCLCQQCIKSKQTMGGSGQIQVTTPVAGHYTIKSALSKEEQQELEALKSERKLATKHLKLAEFKNLPPELRQHVIDNVMWQAHKQRISVLQAPHSQRELDLRSKESMILTTADMHEKESDGYYGLSSAFLPKGLSVEDLIQAHSDATIEDKLE